VPIFQSAIALAAWCSYCINDHCCFHLRLLNV
jgi:hypothetical protein